jgi:hypothetical protein
MSEIRPEPPRPEPMVTLRMPLANWRGIVNGIEKWVGDSATNPEIEILQDIELVAGPSSAIWWLNGFYDREGDEGD